MVGSFAGFDNNVQEEILIDEYRISVHDSVILYTGYLRGGGRGTVNHMICTNRVAQRIEEAGIFSFSELAINN